ncbi:hypothetical protein H5410_056856 [Solanum commersonii]|uniref:Indigoidine synthase A family protein n=1 Tax=Solanum commersonii TaxID=4109 RepID=A0A9J5WMG7_SOLCO|nr:hypothetical protein H5410_056856 [Solanum commersonii]
MADSRLAILSRHFTSAAADCKVPPLNSVTMQAGSGSFGQNLGWIKISPEVSEALKHGTPIVALESTIISHGMPYPQNFETAKELEVIVRENGAVPATIAILDGVPCIGLTTEELEILARLGSKARKTASRDIALVMAGRENGATTVSATMYLASKVGIPVFVTGGIGGVHRHGENTMDVSSDLTELGNTPVAVISAGIKSILDIPRTLEYLETQRVTVAAYRTDEFPAFFTQTSGCKAPARVESPEHCARVIGKQPYTYFILHSITHANIRLEQKSGILIAVPIPREHSASGSLIESAIQLALQEAREKKITGNAETPFLLARVNELTGGASLASISDIALVKNNASIGAKIAVSLAQLQKRSYNRLVVILLYSRSFVSTQLSILSSLSLKEAAALTYEAERVLLMEVCNQTES